MMTLTEWEARKAFVGFGPKDEEVLVELHLVARTYADQVMDDLYARWLQVPELRAHFDSPERLARVKALQRRYFIRLTQGEYGQSYFEDRLNIGRVHRRIGLEPRWYMGAYSIYMQTVFPRVLSAFEYDRTRRDQAINALTKLITLDQELALSAYFAG
jgi:hypothetical protein